MLTYIDYKSVDVIVDLDVRFTVRLEPGLWVVAEQGRTYSVTTLTGCLQPGINEVRLMYPKGVARRPSGAWAAREHLLADFRHWRLVPDDVRAAIDDAYTLRRAALPNLLGELP